MKLSQESDEAILAVATPIMDNLMDASTVIDYQRHVRDFTERARSSLSKDSLRAICNHYQSTKGLFAGREFVAVFRRPESVSVVWRQRFTKHPGEFVAQLVLVEQDGEYKVEYVMVV